MPCSRSHAGTRINRYRKYYGQAACPKLSGLLLRKNMRGTNVARLRISVWFVGNAECAGINRHVVGDERALQERRTATPILASSLARDIVRCLVKRRPCAAHIEDSFSEPQKLSPILTTYGAFHSPSDQEPRLFDFLQRPQEVGQL